METENKKTDIEVIDVFNCMEMVDEVVVFKNNFYVNLARRTQTLRKEDLMRIMDAIGSDRNFSINLPDGRIIVERLNHNCGCEDGEITPED